MAFMILINLIFSTITLISNLLSLLIFKVTACLLVIAIQGLKVPGEAILSAMEQFGDLIRGCVESLLEIILEVISEIVGLVFGLVKDGIFGSVTATGAAAIGLIEMMRSGYEGLLEQVPALISSVFEMITTMVQDLWNNYMDAQSYVTENA